MPISVVVGAQFGDEGKGKLVDYFAQQYDMVIRYQGGDNAGHTVINSKGVFKMHLVPCGIFYPQVTCLIGTGVVANLDVLLEEMQMLEKAGVNTQNLLISGKAHLIMPYHILLDEAMEKKGGIGTTKRGIGQAYSFKLLRKNLRAEDLLNTQTLPEKVRQIVEMANAQLAFWGAPPCSPEDILAHCLHLQAALKHRIVDPFPLIHNAIAQQKRLLFEGQLGVMKDIDLGIYPYVTSSNPIATYAAVSGGFSPKLLTHVVGVAKAFSSAVGDGPFPTEMLDDTYGLRGTGEHPDDEFGARTGRSRRIGWLDLPVLQYAAAVNGFDELALTKLDKLDGFAQIKICTQYTLDGKAVQGMPRTEDLYRVEPIYETLPGWQADTTRLTSYDALPANAKAYICFIEKQVGIPIKYIGNGPAREHLIVRP